MERLRIQESDLEEHFDRSSGPGGQNVNKVATCVHLQHRPSRISVRSDTYRSQHRNRIAARRLLCQKLEDVREQRKRQREQAKRKKRLAISNRPRKVKENMLRAKKHRSEIKQHRRPPTTE